MKITNFQQIYQSESLPKDLIENQKPYLHVVVVHVFKQTKLIVFVWDSREIVEVKKFNDKLDTSTWHKALDNRQPLIDKGAIASNGNAGANKAAPKPPKGSLSIAFPTDKEFIEAMPDRQLIDTCQIPNAKIDFDYMKRSRCFHSRELSTRHPEFAGVLKKYIIRNGWPVRVIAEKTDNSNDGHVKHERNGEREYTLIRGTNVILIFANNANFSLLNDFSPSDEDDDWE